MAFTLGVYIEDHPHTVGHVRDVEELASIEHVLMAGSERAAQIAARMHKADFVGGWAELIAREGLDAVVVLTNNRDAGRMTLQALERGLYVYGEKPGARTVEEMEAITEAARSNNAHFTPCYVRRTFSETHEIRRLLDEGAVGRLWSFQANWITSQAELRGADHWLFDGERAGAGILYWLCCHWIDHLRFVTGERIVSVGGMTGTMDERISVEDVACVCARLEGGAIGTLRCGYLLNPYEPYDDYQLMTAFEGSHGALSYFPHGRTTLRLRTRAAGLTVGSELREITIEEERPGGYAGALLSDFVEAARKRVPPMVTAEDALYVMRVIEAVLKASRTGSEQQVES